MNKKTNTPLLLGNLAGESEERASLPPSNAPARQMENSEEGRRIQITKGKFVLVDKDDYDFLTQWKWYLDVKGYACRNSATSNGKRRTILMHREVNHTPEGFFTDHINGNKLDNRRSNLRTATNQQNAYNRGENSNNTSGFKGVSWENQKKKFRARIWISGKCNCLGFFESPEAASSAYREAANRLHGEFVKQ